jgi:hypothetical protein
VRRHSQPPLEVLAVTTKTEIVFNRVTELIDGGMSKANAFRQVAEELGRTPDSVRGSFYSYAGSKSGSRKPRRRQTTPADAVADARAAFERALESVDREVEMAAERVRAAELEHIALAESATERKQAIAERLEALR